MQPNDRYQHGLNKLDEVMGEEGRENLKNIEEICPDLARYAVEYAYGDVWSRPGLDLRAREIATIAALAAMGTTSLQLKGHIRGAFRHGVTRDEIVEIMIHLSVYVGFPAAWNGLRVAKEVFNEMENQS